MTDRVAHVMRTYGVHGGERQLAQLFSSFANPSFKHVFFYVYRDDLCERFFSRINGLEGNWLIPLRARAFPRLRTEILVLGLLLPILQCSLLIQLLRRDTRIVVAHGLQGALVSWLAACVLWRRQFVYVHRGTKSNQGKHPLFRLIYRPFDRVAGVSRASSDSLARLVPASKLIVLENGIDLTAFPQKTVTGRTGSQPVLISVARLMPAKGQRFLLQAFAELRREFPAAELILVGDGPDENALRGHARQLNIADAVLFAGHLNNVVELLAKSDIFVFASESEGLSNAVLEAMAIGLPSVVVDAPGVSECHVDGVTGFVTPRDVVGFSQKVATIAHSPGMQASFGDAARLRAKQHYSIEANWRRYAALYEDLQNSDAEKA